VRRAALVVVAALLAGCSDTSSGPGNPAAERGREIYLAQCLSCHGPDPAATGPLGPPIKGSPAALLEAKVVRGTYPAGYAPKRPTAAMPPLPALAPEVPALAEFLK
jgi:mono/diheme cytochrome c family protein